MKIILVFIIIAIATFGLSLVLPWWVIAPICLLTTFISKLKPAYGFIIPFFAVLVTWIVCIYITNFDQVAELMGKLFQNPGILTPVVASILAALVAGLFGLSGTLLVQRKKHWVNA